MEGGSVNQRAKPIAVAINPDADTYATLVDDPYEHGAQIVATRRKSDFIAKEHAAGRIDNAQKAAADHFYRLRVITMSSGISSPAFAREFVDSCRMDKAISDKVVEAFQRLTQARILLGMKDYDCLDDCITEGINPSAAERQWDKRVNAQRIKDALETLAIYWGYVTDPKHKRRKAQMVSMVGEAFELAIMEQNDDR